MTILYLVGEMTKFPSLIGNRYYHLLAHGSTIHELDYIMTKPLTNQQKSANRNLALNEIARRLGFESWRKLETKIKRGEYIIIPAPKDKPHAQ